MFSFTGRLNRTTFLLGNILLSLLVLPIYNLDDKQQAALENNFIYSLLIMILLISIINFIFALTIKRVHDFGVSGWYALFAIIPGVQILYLFIPGQKTENKYGKTPDKLFDLAKLFVN